MAMPTFDVAGVSIPKIGIGTFNMDGEPATCAVAEGLQGGYRHVDTAEMYGNEVAVGEGIRASGLARDEIFVTTKVWHDHLSDSAMQAACEASLKRLGLDRVDLYLIHWPSRDVPVAEAIAALNRIHSRGLARSIGISNFPTKLIEEAVHATEVELAVNQVEYHPFMDQGPVMAALAKHGMGLTAYCPLARGKVLEDETIAGIAARHDVTPAALTLAWLIGQDSVIAIPKSSSPARLMENLEAVDVVLTAQERAALDALRSPAGRLVDPEFAPDWD
ncbi:aldo/keto reductase [Acuticoccus sp. I52.16.1]|uniref:aldo/keto reductase n=1 Tax=Acuticoccus sp. I52.16.1 TaxID=2928472 RepID=UPI001FD4A540|nr:aldo/keto reductase [Acuticoccus sp. I52.16.1]UOM34118.1 aldo/keto reductase [Acuticoccus sp. I52.16.1]